MVAPGGNVPGGTLIMTATEYEQTAATQVTRASLGVVPDSVELSLAQLDRAATWKYQSTASNPSLSAPLVNIRMSLLGATTDSSWTEEFDRLLDLLPENIKARLLYESGLSPEERSASYAALDSLLGGVARANVWLRVRQAALSGAGPNQPSDVIMDAARQGVIAQGSEILRAARTFLDNAGHNLSNYDEMNNLVSQMQDALNDMEALSRQVPMTSENKATLANIATHLNTLSRQLQAKTVGDDLQILKPMVEVMSLVTAASVMETGSPYLLLGLHTAGTGINQADSSLGIMPKILGNLRDNISAVLSDGLLPKADAGSKRLLPLLVTASFAAAVGFMDLANPEIAKEGFPLQLAVNFASHSGALQALGKGVVRACGADDKSQDVAGHILTSTAALLMIHAAQAKNGKLAVPLLETLRPDLISSFKAIEDYAMEAMQQGKGNLEATAATILIQQGRVALENGDYDTALQVFLDASKVMQGDEDVDNSKALTTFYDSIARVSPSGLSQGDAKFSEALTGITQV
jgi:hypothetical protein